MLFAAIMIFCIAAIFGLIILSAILKNLPTPKLYVFWHGPIALLGLMLVFVTIYYGPKDPLLIASAVLFVLAALGGLTLFTIDMSRKRIPKLLAIGHPILAVIALILLIMYVWSYKPSLTNIYTVGEGAAVSVNDL